MKQTTINTIVAGIMAVGALSQSARAESDALLQKLVQKGILTTKEAEDLGKDSKEEARHSWVVGAGLPEWVKSMRLYGDFRGRFEQNGADNPAYVERDRYRYRLRLGTVLNLE